MTSFRKPNAPDVYELEADSDGDIMPDVTFSSSEGESEGGTTKDRRSRDLEKRALCKRVCVLRRVLRIEQSRGDLSETMAMVASVNATSE